MPNRIQHYKTLDAAGRATHGGNCAYDLPKERHDGAWMPGAWMPRITPVVPCESGYHTWTRRDGLLWMGPTIWRAEVRGLVMHHNDKYVSGEIRLTSGTCWNETTARSFAVQCALDVLPLYEAHYPADSRVSDCLVTAWEYALGTATPRDLVDAGAAVRAAAWAEGAEGAEGAARAARAAAWAEGAEGAAGADDLRLRQSARLIRYLDGDIPLFPEWPDA